MYSSPSDRLPTLAASTSVVAAPAICPSETFLSSLLRAIPIPARYSGNLGTCNQSSLAFSTYATDQSTLAFIMSLNEKASAWALTISQNNPSLCSDSLAFSSEMRNVFDDPIRGREATNQPLALNLGKHSVSQYALDFRSLFAEGFFLFAVGIKHHYKAYFCRDF